MSHRTILNSVRTALFGAAALTMSIGWAQQSELPPTSSAAEAQSVTPDAPTAVDAPAATVPVDEQKLEQFADAYVAVQKIQTEAAGELDKSTGDPAEQQQAQAAVESQMIAAVERTGLKLEEFNGIVQTMSADPNLRAKVVEKIRTRVGG